MIPRKLVETALRHLWVLLLPLVLVPAAVIGLSRSPAVYESRAVVWVSSPPGDTSPSIGYTNGYLTHAQNQAIALQDLLATEAFRIEVGRAAGWVTPEMTQEQAGGAVALLPVSVFSSGVNLVTISARSNSPDDARMLVQAVVDEYRERAITETQRLNGRDAEFYRSQLALAEQELQAGRTSLTEYMQEDPRLLDPRFAELDIEYKARQARIESQQLLVQSLEGKLQAAELNLAAVPDTVASTFSLQDEPSQPQTPIPDSATKRFGLPLVGLLFGVLISSSYLFARYRADHTIGSAEDLVDVQVPLLGSVPELVPGGLLYRIPVVRSVAGLRRRGYARTTARGIGMSPDPATSATPGANL